MVEQTQQSKSEAAAALAGENPQVRAILRGARISPQKARLVLNLIKGRQIEPALQILQHSPKKGAKLMLHLLQSAVANARELNSRRGSEIDVDNLWVTGGWIGMGTTLKRWMPRAHGRATPIRKRSSHITIVLGER
jgi:large subunit ribosomal protein L22